ncbi:cyclin-dependent kinase inhibitor 3-like isoform X2 [Tripterygium wilfordii]|uniref:cyclin-dependent kinase inhibitor 3-like isoform X2 n=1 Tax=Tripterygium wilfordii TaxID=458696 RepID=UPI0018F83A00|nr:cyclin-dependent kinase inhibitor 3-like isoform X2 [Tripterygium wilfordii]
MGKYMKKSKIKGDVGVMEVGVRTRAKTLALQRLQSQSPSPDDSSSLCYLQLRSRRLEKPAPPPTCRGDNHGSRREIKRESKEEVEASCGENCLDSGCRDRTTRESTPCSLIRDPLNIVTPGSTSRRRKSSVTNNQRTRNEIQKSNPIMHEVEEFFAYAEQQQKREFVEKYNFDIVNDLPLPGRYEWVQIF